MATYKTGNGTQQINLTVDVNTIGLAASRAIVGIPGSENQPSPVAHSEDATGDIPLSGIGPAVSLQEKTLSIMTKIDLSIIGNEKVRKTEYNKITATYTLDDGEDGHKIFPAPDSKTPSPDFSSVILYSEIKLTK